VPLYCSPVKFLPRDLLQVADLYYYSFKLANENSIFLVTTDSFVAFYSNSKYLNYKRQFFVGIVGKHFEFVGKENHKVSGKNVKLFAAREDKRHVNAVVKLQKYISSICKRRVTYTFIKQEDTEHRKKFKTERGALVVVILSPSLAYCLQQIELWLAQKNNRSTLIYVTMAEDCVMGAPQPTKATLFHLHRDIGMFHNFLSDFFHQNHSKQDQKITRKKLSLKVALNELQKYQSNHNDSKWYEKSLLKTTLDRPFENTLPMVAGKQKRKYFGSSDSTALPTYFEFTGGNTFTGYEQRVHSCFSYTEEEDERGNKIQSKEGMASCQTQSMVGQRSPLLSAWEPISEEIEAISLGGKSV
jgi:hypothetical protein